MSLPAIGILHPGSMGAQVGAQALAAGARVLWLPHGRGESTRLRAEHAGMVPAASLAKLAGECWLIISVCPPAFAVDVAQSVAGTGFSGVYLDANAISPQRLESIVDILPAAVVVDGGIVGPPPRAPGTTRLYLSGDGAAVRRVAEAFAGTALDTVALGDAPGRASALKLAFASYNKVSYLLAAQACAIADGHGVLGELLELTAQALPETPLGSATAIPSAGARAWRWAPEMHEIADACTDAGVSPDLVLAAAGLLDRWRAHKDADVPLEQLIAELRADPIRPA